MARKIIVGDQEFIVPDKFPKSGFTIGLILVLLLAIWSSIYRVELEEEGVLMTLGEYSGLVQSGIHVKWPAPIQTVIKIPTKRELEMEFGQVAGCKVIEGNVYRKVCSLVIEGEDKVHTAMAKTVGLPLGIMARQLLQGKLGKEGGVIVPLMKRIYGPVLKELENNGIRFKKFIT